jgi:hypothetical protein
MAPARAVVLALPLALALPTGAGCVATAPPDPVVVVEPAYVEGVIEVIHPRGRVPQVQVSTSRETVVLLGPLIGQLRELGGERVALVGTLIDSPNESALIVSEYRRRGGDHEV